jgi:flagellar biosynthesis/type III secretory pathway chaperone
VTARGGLDPDVCREHLGTLLTEEIVALRELEELLKREYEILGATNVAAIERTALVRQQMMGDLARTEEQRRQLCTMHGYTPDWVGLESLMQWCDAEGTLLSRLRECASRATRCRDLNDKNGTLVAARLKHVEGLLSALTGGVTQQPGTYGPKGSAPKVNRSHEWGRV